MNETLQNYARIYLKEGLAQCTEDQQLLFRRMYSPTGPDRSMEDVVDHMPEDKLEWAMHQVKRTLAKAKKASQ